MKQRVSLRRHGSAARQGKGAGGWTAITIHGSAVDGRRKAKAPLLQAASGQSRRTPAPRLQPQVAAGGQHRGQLRGRRSAPRTAPAAAPPRHRAPAAPASFSPSRGMPLEAPRYPSASRSLSQLPAPQPAPGLILSLVYPPHILTPRWTHTPVSAGCPSPLPPARTQPSALHLQPPGPTHCPRTRLRPRVFHCPCTACVLPARTTLHPTAHLSPCPTAWVHHAPLHAHPCIPFHRHPVPCTQASL